MATQLDTAFDEDFSNFCSVRDFSPSFGQEGGSCNLKMPEGLGGRAGSEEFICPEDKQAIINPCILQDVHEEGLKMCYAGIAAVGASSTAESLNSNSNLEQSGVCVHRLNTEMENSCATTRDPLSSGYKSEDLMERYKDISSSPSPLPEPVFEPYVFCTKTRSETSCSNESQCSGSSVERDAVSPSPLSLVCSALPRSSPSLSKVHHRPLVRQTQSNTSVGEQSLSLSMPQDKILSTCLSKKEDSGGKKVVLISPDHKLMIKTRPIKPPRNFDLDDSSDDDDGDDNECSPLSSKDIPSSNQPHSIPYPSKSQYSSKPQYFHRRAFPQSSSFLNSLDLQRSQTVTFLQCKEGEESGKFCADYLGMKEVDMYIKSINSVAKELTADQRPKEVQVYVTSKRIRLAPPNSATLFLSFAVKDILFVRQCSKNKRIIGIMIWKSKDSKPACHILRCRDNITAVSLFDALWEQTQKVDDVPSSEVDVEPHPLSNANTSGNEDAITEILHRFPALYVGSTTISGKVHSINTVIEKVLNECRPSEAKMVSLSLSLLEIRLMEEKSNPGTNQRERILFLSHETSRIRAMGVFLEDKRFAGYIIKEEGKAQMGHVIKCNSAALMVSFTSFLRQSCQLTSSQRGGTFYDELSTDESEDWETSVESTLSSLNDNSGIVKRIRSFTMSLSQRAATSTSTSATTKQPSPTFQSHTRNMDSIGTGSSTLPPPSSLSHAIPKSPAHRNKDNTITSPLECTEDEYARFPVTYIGSAIHDYLLTQDSVEDALSRFSSEGTAAGQAAVLKNTIHLQVSSLGINLMDKTHKLFIHRNYPCKTIVGYCRHPTDPKLFAFASHRPGFPNIKKVHVFRCGVEPVEQIMDAIKYWLKMDPITSS